MAKTCLSFARDCGLKGERRRWHGCEAVSTGSSLAMHSPVHGSGYLWREPDPAPAGGDDHLTDSNLLLDYYPHAYTGNDTVSCTTTVTTGACQATYPICSIVHGQGHPRESFRAVAVCLRQRYACI